MTEIEILPPPYDFPPEADGIKPRPETISLVQSQIDALLHRTPSFLALHKCDRDKLSKNLVHIGAYAAELARDNWAQTKRIGQIPMVRHEELLVRDDEIKPKQGEKDLKSVSRALAAQADLRTTATGQVAAITQSTLRAIAFPTFVADLINGTFDAIIGATIKQMQAFKELLENVSKTVTEFERDNITDNQARDYLVQSYPKLMQVEIESNNPTLVITEKGEEAGDAELAGMQDQLALPDPVRSLDEEILNEKLIPGARRKLAQSRLQMLSSMVMLGLQRIVIRHGRIRATMGFHIDASDRASAQEASTFDFSHKNSVQGMFYVAFSAQTSVAYVRSTQSDSDSAINVQADLTGEVDLTFESDYLPLNRMIRADSIERIRQNTPNPETNTPMNHSAAQTTKPTNSPSAASIVDSRMKAHRSDPAPSIDKQLIDAAAGAARGLAKTADNTAASINNGASAGGTVSKNSESHGVRS